ncbi:MAG: ATPase [Bacteroidaceae bacterium]|nr:ATPase [Bacteroidaceae bacterium]
MKLIADSGSTKTAWCLIHNDGQQTEVSTQGINPFQQTEADITAIIQDELLPQLNIDKQHTLEIHFYGAGCTPEASPKVASALRQALGPGADIEVQSDMLGAARALCGHSPGLIAILGTGSNSCYYDGTRITDNIPPLGFILGDEGSGAYIGKRLVGDVLKRQLPPALCQQFFEETHETAATIIQKTYRQPLPNRFLASLSPFCARHRDTPTIHQLLTDCFTQFFVRNIKNYDQPTRTVHFVGSIAHHYQAELTEAAIATGYSVGNVLQAPICGLIQFHA